jgi:hypothetical protein
VALVVEHVFPAQPSDARKAIKHFQTFAVPCSVRNVVIAEVFLSDDDGEDGK